MEKQIEVEFIGDITQEKFNELKDKFENEGTFKKRKERISLMYFRDKIPKDISEIKDEDTDLRLRITNKEPEIIIKKGSFTGTHSRKEISINFPISEMQKYVDFLSALNWNIGVIYAVETFVYEYKGIEFSLVDIEDYGYNFEAEILTTSEDEPNARVQINKMLEELGLKPFNEKGLNKQCNEINNREELRFNFAEQNIKEIQKKFSKFF
jgi:CYTH domain-containing protein